MAKYTYEKTVKKKNPEYLEKHLLLSNLNRKNLYSGDRQHYIEARFNRDGELNVRTVSIESPKNKESTDISLRGLGEKYLNLEDPSVEEMLKYLIIPELEVERIFNSLRYHYLEAIYNSGFEDFRKYIHADYNRSFQALAGLRVYQGNTKSRVNNDDFYLKPWLCKRRLPKDGQGFKDETSFKSVEKTNMEFITRYLREISRDNEDERRRLYRELISIKPGFHELWVHHDYFEEVSELTNPRDQVRKLIRSGCKPELDPNEVKKKMSREIKYPSYFTYASCSVTEGPFVFRKDLSVSYFDEIKKIRDESSREKIRKKSSGINKKFKILSYKSPCEKIKSRKELGRILSEAESFLEYP